MEIKKIEFAIDCTLDVQMSLDEARALCWMLGWGEDALRTQLSNFSQKEAKEQVPLIFEALSKLRGKVHAAEVSRAKARETMTAILADKPVKAILADTPIKG